MIEYRVMFNCYDGVGHVVHSIHTKIEDALRDKFMVDIGVVNVKGKSWIEAREVNDWKEVFINEPTKL